MKIKFELDLEDLLIEDFDYYEDKEELRLKDDSELKDAIHERITESIVDNIKSSLNHSFSYEIDKAIKTLVEENKQMIIDNVVKEVSKKIINLKQIKEFRKTLDE